MTPALGRPCAGVVSSLRTWKNSLRRTGRCFQGGEVWESSHGVGCHLRLDINEPAIPIEVEKRPGVVSPAQDRVAAGQSQLAQATIIVEREPGAPALIGMPSMSPSSGGFKDVPHPGPMAVAE